MSDGIILPFDFDIITDIFPVKYRYLLEKGYFLSLLIGCGRLLLGLILLMHRSSFFVFMIILFLAVATLENQNFPLTPLSSNEFGTNQIST